MTASALLPVGVQAVLYINYLATLSETSPTGPFRSAVWVNQENYVTNQLPACSLAEIRRVSMLNLKYSETI